VLIGAFIPLIGAPIVMTVATVVALAANGVPQAFVVLAGLVIIGQVEGHVLQPSIMGKQVALHPVVVATAVAAGTVVGSILGAVMAIPLVSIVWAVFGELRPAPDPESTDRPEQMTATGDE
jgi:predicted PurR-regulated permease PerM